MSKTTGSVTLSIRMPARLHGCIKHRALQNQRSLNAEMVFRLKHSYGVLPATEGDTESPGSATAASEEQPVLTCGASRSATAG